MSHPQRDELVVNDEPQSRVVWRVTGEGVELNVAASLEDYLFLFEQARHPITLSGPAAWHLGAMLRDALTDLGSGPVRVPTHGKVRFRLQAPYGLEP